MTKAAVFLTATLLSASLGAVAQNSSNPAERRVYTQNTAPAQNAQPTALSSAAPDQGTTGLSNKGSEAQAQKSPAQNHSTQNSLPPDDKQDPRTASAELPQTSTILPLLGLLGLGSLVAGLFARR